MERANPLAFALERIAGLLNRNVAESTPARALLARLKDRSFAVIVTGLALRVRLCADGERLALEASDLPADASLEGPPIALLLLLAETELRPQPGAVSISGDPEVAQLFQKLLRHARPELEAELARYVGEVAARRVGEFAGAALRFHRQALASLGRNAAEYLVHESRDLASPAELAGFAAAVDALRDAAERAAARLARLEERRARRSA
jgi:ubiquinone biosynthesis accessory factor UbiJ